MKVSVIIPIYNVEGYVASCLESVLNQTYPDLEIILVNDATKDRSMEMVHKVLSSCAGSSKDVIIVEHQQNAGLSAARNTGIKNSTGEYLYFLDSDDTITPSCIASMVKALSVDRADMVVADYELQGTTLPFPRLELGACVLKEKKEVRKAILKRKIYPMAWNKLVRRDFILKHGLYFKDGLLHEDCLWNFRCACCLSSVAVVKDKTYVYRVREGSIMTGIPLEKDFSAYLTVLECMLDAVGEFGLQDERLVFDFIEEEKFFLNYAYFRKYDIPESLLASYFRLVRVRKPSLWQILIWGSLHKSTRMRDAHYFLDDVAGRKYYENLADYKWRYHEKHLMKAFNKWFFKVLCHKGGHLCGNPCEFVF